MMRTRLLFSAMAFFTCLAGCSDSMVQPVVVSSTPVAVGNTMVISAATTELRVGEENVLLATASDNKAFTASILWQSQSPNVLQIVTGQFAVAHIRGLSPGVAIVSATSNGQTQTIAITVSALPPPSGSVIVVDEFSVVEFQYPSVPGYWYYAPLVKVRETGLGSGAAVIAYTFLIPGFGAAPPCNTYRRVERGQTLNLFREVYGDYGFTVDSQGARATARTATAVITVVDGSGAPTKLTVSGPIITGSLPTTYTGGTVDWSCR